MPTTNGVITNTGEALLLDHVCGNTSMARADKYMGLLIATPTDAGGTEVATAGTLGYSRINVSNGGAGAALFGTAATRAIATNADITFGPCITTPWSAASYWGLFDASTAGNLLAYGDTTDGSVVVGDSYKIASTALSMTFTAGTKWTDTVLNALLELLIGKTAYTMPTPFLALYNGDPLGAGAESTVAGTNGYARADFDVAMGAASGGTITNPGVISFGPASGSPWGLSDYYAVMTAVTAGAVMHGALLTASKTVAVGDSAEFAASALTLTLD